MGKLALNNHRATSIVIFGASGDLTKRKLMPSLYILFKQNRLPEKISVIGVGRTEYSDSNYRDYIRGELKLYLKDKDYDQSSIDGFLTNLYYVTADPSKVEYYIVTGKQNIQDRKSTRLNSSHRSLSRMPSSA